MPQISDIDKKFMADLNIKEEDLAEAKYNLIGFFEVLYGIDKRLREEKQIQQ
ncbi:MAG: hypothetical protein WC415_02925 [Patescibacteria group bacterium]|jgi:hypothetical protein